MRGGFGEYKTRKEGNDQKLRQQEKAGGSTLINFRRH